MQRIHESPITDESSQEFSEYASLVGFGKNPLATKALSSDLDALFTDDGKEQVPAAEAVKRIRIFQAIIGEKLNQILAAGPDNFVRRQVASPDQVKRSPRTMLKFIQQIFSDKSVFQDFSKEEITARGEDSLAKDVIINPSRITNTMLKSFGLDEFIPPKGTLVEDQIHARARAIPKIKDFFMNNLDSLLFAGENDEKHGYRKSIRLFRINSGKNNGYILGSRTRNGDNKKLFLTDLQGAFRSLENIKEGYDREIEFLQRISGLIDDVTKRISEDWEGLKNSGELVDIQKKIFSYVNALKYVENGHKTDILNRFRRCVSFKDKSAKLNPGSRLAIMAPSKNSIAKRMMEISRISSYLAEDRVHLLSSMKEEANRVDSFYRDIEKYSDRIKICDVEHPIPERDRPKILDNLKKLKSNFSSFKFQPYLAIAEKMLNELDVVISAIESGDESLDSRETSRKSFLKVYCLAKVVELKKTLIDLREEFFAPGQKMRNIWPERLAERIEEIRSNFVSKRVSPEVNIDDYTNMYAEINEALVSMIDSVKKASVGGVTETERVKILRDVSLNLEKFSLSDFMEEVV